MATELFYGCLRNKLALDFLVRQLAHKMPRPRVAEIVKLGLYQLLFLDRIPPHAAVYETVELAKSRVVDAGPGEVRFVNAALRRVARNRVLAVTSLRAIRDTEPWVYYSHPQWLWDRWRARWGNDSAAALCEWNNQPPSVYVRWNSLEGRAPSRPLREAASATTGRGPVPGGLEPATYHPYCFRVTDPVSFFASEAWSRGAYYVQDPSTLIAVDVLDPQPGESVLDVCAAPGGKTTYIAQKMENRGRIIAADSSSARLGLVAENCKRLGVRIVATLPCDGTRLNRCLRGERFDRVLVDAPCSNTGVMRRRPDLRWRLEEKEIARLAAVQLRLLRAAAEFTKPGGVLVYSTCSLETEENERVVEQFSAAQAECVLETTRSTFPPRDGVDGAFVARLRRS